MNKNIINISNPKYYHMVGDGFRVHNLLPGYGEQMSNRSSPFLMLDYNSPWPIPGDGVRRGVGYHPHRGIETVTLVYAGEVEHSDTAGNGGVIGPGDVQWMTAGSGLLHQELITETFAKKGGKQEFVQLWVNLPRVSKMTAPRYQSITKDAIPSLQGENYTLRIIAGEQGGLHGPTTTYSPVELYELSLQKDGVCNCTLPQGYVSYILVRRGEGSLQNGTTYKHRDFIEFSRDGESLQIQAYTDSEILIMAGLPIDEPIVHDGPFVMNTEKEILQAWEDFKSGKMGKTAH